MPSTDLFELSPEEQDRVRRTLAALDRRGYDDTILDPVVRRLKERLDVAYDARLAAQQREGAD